MELRELGTLREEIFCTIHVCEDENEDQYTVWEITKQKLAKRLMCIGELEPRCRCIKAGEQTRILFPYEEPRPLLRFYKGALCDWRERKRVYENLIEICKNQNLPYPILYLLLKNRCLNIKNDGSISFHYNVSLYGLSWEKEESDCVLACAGLLLELMRQGDTEEKACYARIRKKYKKMIYQQFEELAEDLKLLDGKRRFLPFVSLQKPTQRRIDKGFRVIFILVVILFAAAAALFIFQTIFGEIPFLRMFTFSFVLEH